MIRAVILLALLAVAQGPAAVAHGSAAVAHGSAAVAQGFSPAKPPSRIVSLIPAVTEMVFAIGAGRDLVGVSSFDRYPPDVRSITKVGGLLDPDVERILSLRPDLVIVYGSQQDLQTQMARAGIPMFNYRHGGVSDLLLTLRQLGERTGRAAQADMVAKRIENDLAAIRTRVSGRRRPRTLLVFGRQPGALRGMYASGGYGFLHDMLEIAGGTNVFADVKRESVQATTEQILAQRPEVILEIRADASAGTDSTRERQVWGSVPSVPAVRSGRVHFLIGDDLVVPGPRIVRGTERMARALHPEAF